jgi:hypothetical protein
MSNDKVNQALAEFIDKVNQGMDIAAGQIPVVLEQVLMWHTITAFIGLVVGIVVFLGLPWYVYDKYKEFENTGEENSLFKHSMFRESQFQLTDYGDIVAIGGGSLWLIMSLVMIGSVETLLQIYVAPELYLFEYAKEALK